MEKSLNFRNVIVGSSDSDCAKPNNPWPKLCDKSKSKKPSGSLEVSEEAESPKCSPSETIAANNSGLNPLEFPALSRKPVARTPNRNWPQKNEKNAPSQKSAKTREGPLQSAKKKKIKHSSPFSVDISDIIQMSTLKSQWKNEAPAAAKKTRRKTIVGNRLDGEAPQRLHKGKCRVWKPRFLSKTKKTFCASWKIRISRIPFSREMLRFKEDLGAAVKSDRLDVDRLVDRLSGVDLSGTVGEGSGAVPAPEVSSFAKDIVHNKKFRRYCTNVVTSDLKENVSRLVETLRRFQDRAHAKDEIKARMRKRYVCGFRESKKFLTADRVKMVVVATNLDIGEGLPSMAILSSLTELAGEKGVPIVFAGLAQNIAHWSMKKGKISVLAVMNYEGADDLYQRVLTSWAQAKSDYGRLLSSVMEKSAETQPPDAETAELRAEENFAEALLRKLTESDAGISRETKND